MDELCNVTPNPNQPYVGANAFAHKGGMHVAGVNRDARTFEHVDPAEVGADRRVLVSELSGKGTVQARADVDDETAARVIERVKELEHRGYQFEAADGSFDLLIRKETGEYEPLFRLESWRAIVEKREDGRVETEATIKIWVDGERYVRTAEGNGPVNALDTALRAAIGERYPHLRDIELVNFKVRILDERKGTGAVTRVLLDASDGQDTWGTIGVSENIIEASWEALVDSLEAGMLPGRTAARAGARGAATERDPAGAPVGRARARRSWCSRRSAPAGWRSARGSASSRRAFAAALGAEHVSAVSSGTAGLHLAIRAAGVEPGDEVVTTPFSLRRVGQLPALRGRAAGLLRHRPAHAQHRPRQAAAAARDRAHHRPAAGAHLRLPGRHAGASSGWPPTARCGSSRTPARRSAPRTPTARAVGARGNLSVFGFYPNKQLTTGEGGAVVSPRRP